MREKKLTTKAVEANLKDIIEKYDLSQKISIAKVKTWVASEVGEPNTKEAFEKYVATWSQYLPKIEDIEEMNQIFTAFIDAWNYFPHKSLDNKAPVEVKDKTIKARLLPKAGTQKTASPKPTNAAEALAMEFYKEIFKKQEPFIDWVYRDALPSYEKYLEKVYPTLKARKRHMAIATLFLDRCIRLGFENYEEIPKRFIYNIFPRFWEENIFPEPLTARQVTQSLNKLFTFVYHNFYRFPARIGDKSNTECVLASIDRFLPGLAEAEREEIKIKGKQYTLLEQYCIDTFCDCKKAVLSLVNSKEKKVAATIGIQWGNKTNKKGKEEIRFFLDATGEQTSRAGELLKEVTRLFLKDRTHIDHLKRHYLLFKRAV